MSLFFLTLVILQNALAQMPEFKQYSSFERTNAWSFPGLFHFTRKGRLIEGTVQVAASTSTSSSGSKRQTGIFDFSKSDNQNDDYFWSDLDGNNTKFKHSHECIWCTRASPMFCSKGGEFYASVVASGDSKFDEEFARHFRTRPFAENQTNYLPKYRTLVVTCDFSQVFSSFPVSMAKDEFGVLKLSVQGFQSFSPLVNKLFVLNDDRDDVVCASGLSVIESLDHSTLVRFSSYYLNVLGFSKVVIYHFGGLNSQFHRSTKALVKTGKLVFINMQKAVYRMYGATEWRDVVLYSRNSMQQAFMVDCAIRSKAFKTYWSVFVNLNEFLFRAELNNQQIQFQPPPSFRSLVDRVIPDKVRSLSISVHSVRVNCDSYFDSHSLDLDGMIAHKLKSSKVHFVSHKNLLRFDLFDPVELGIHDIFSQAISVDGHWSDPFKEFFIRRHICEQSLKWFD